MNVTQCSRCSFDHINVTPLPLARPFAPPEAAPVTWTHYFTCPTNSQPVMVIYEGVDDLCKPRQRFVTKRAREHPSHLPQADDRRVFAAIVGARYDSATVLVTTADLHAADFHDWLNVVLRCRLPPNVNPRLEVLP
jgi:hypothetical protein